MKKHETFNSEKELQDRIEELKKKNFGELEYEIINTLEERSFVLSYEDFENPEEDEITDGLKDQDKNDFAQNDRPAGYSTEFKQENGIK